MKDVNFHYWLKGSLELGKVENLDKKDIEMILKHISLVENKSYFISWLEGFLIGNITKVDNEKLKILKNKLEKEFNNVSKDIVLPSIFQETIDSGRRGPCFLREEPLDPKKLIC